MKIVEDWEQISEIFNDAFELPAGERQEFLRKACEGDTELRRRIEQWILEEEEDKGFLVRPMVSLSETLPEEDPSVGRRVGPYELVRRLAHGGMGTVFLAHRVDGQIEQQVAVKLLRPGYETDDLVRRFYAERQALERLRHPNVAQFLDVGTTDDGLPYMVMEFVDGHRIDTYCDTLRLTIRQRIELFLQLCDAVTFAHNNGVIHRDLKPANVLVLRDSPGTLGRVKLLDFGVAKFTEPDDPGHGLTETQLLAPMSRLYASPEQQRPNGVVNTLSDVYSLGAVLYELLTGQRAHFVSMADPVDAVRAVHEHTPLRPSLVVTRPVAGTLDGSEPVPSSTEIAQQRRTDVKGLRRILSGDLDKILLKALRKEPSRRFASVAEFSEDLLRYLAGLPVRSRPDTFGYRAGKFARRHPWGLSAAILILLLAVGSMLYITVQSSQIAWQNEVITKERDRAEETLRLLVDVLGASDPRRARGEVPDLQDIFDRAALKWKTEGQVDPRVRATLLDAIGVVYLSLDLQHEARPWLEEALALRRAYLEVEDPHLAESLHNLAKLELRDGNDARSEELMREAIAYQRRIWPEGHRSLALGLNNFASLLRRRGRAEDAERWVLEALDMKVHLLGEDDVAVATSLNLLAHLLKEKGALEEADAYYRRAIAIRRVASGDLDPTLAIYLNSLGLLTAEHRNRADEGLPLLRESLAINRHVYRGMDHSQLVNILNSTAVVLAVTGEYTEAGALFAEALAMAERLGTSRLVLWKNETMRLAAIGDFEACEQLTASIFEEETRPDRVAETQSIRGTCLAGLGRRVEAEPLLRQGYRTLSDLLGEDVRRTRQARQRLASFQQSSRGRGEQGEQPTKGCPPKGLDNR